MLATFRIQTDCLVGSCDEIRQVTVSFLKEIKGLFFFVALKVLAFSCCFKFTGVPFEQHPLWIPTEVRDKAQFCYIVIGQALGCPDYFSISVVPSASPSGDSRCLATAYRLQT